VIEPVLPEGAASDAARLEGITHLALLAGRLLLQNGADTEQVLAAVHRFAAAYGTTANVVVGYEAILVTIVDGAQFRTKSGHWLPGMNVGIGAVDAVNRVVAEAARGGLAAAEAAKALDAIEHAAPAYPYWLVILALGLTAASLSRLFGGDWQAFVIAGVAAATASWLRLMLGARHVNPLVVSFAVSVLGGVIGGFGVRLGATATPSLCLVAPAMILVPGVPLINGVQDIIRNHVTVGVSRLAFAGVVTGAVAVGLFVATLLTGIAVPIDAQTVAIDTLQDAAFSAVAASGFALLFGVPRRMLWASALCGVASHTLRAVVFHAGIDIISGTLLGALAAGCLAQAFAARLRTPAVAFAFPGTVAMIPGAYAFRAVIGCLQIAHGAADPALVAETLSLLVTVALMVGGIASGIAVPALLLPTPRADDN
jgi:uncharacterized membrane protein YjjP (DUF1212 family)